VEPDDQTGAPSQMERKEKFAGREEEMGKEDLGVFCLSIYRPRGRKEVVIIIIITFYRPRGRKEVVIIIIITSVM